MGLLYIHNAAFPLETMNSLDTTDSKGVLTSMNAINYANFTISRQSLLEKLFYGAQLLIDLCKILHILSPFPLRTCNVAPPHLLILSPLSRFAYSSSFIMF